MSPAGPCPKLSRAQTSKAEACSQLQGKKLYDRTCDWLILSNTRAMSLLWNWWLIRRTSSAPIMVKFLSIIVMKFSFLHLDIIRSSIRSWTWHACTSPWALKHGSIILLLMSSFKQFSAASSRSKSCLSLTNPSAIHFLTKTLVQITQSSGYAPRYSKHVLSSWDRLIVAKS